MDMHAGTNTQVPTPTFTSCPHVPYVGFGFAMAPSGIALIEPGGGGGIIEDYIDMEEDHVSDISATYLTIMALAGLIDIGCMLYHYDTNLTTLNLDKIAIVLLY